LVRQDALAQVEAGAAELDVSAGVPGAGEVALLSQVMQEVMAVVEVPLSMLTLVCHFKKVMHRAWEYFEPRRLHDGSIQFACTMAWA
jgi:cobalamin-dependent methionine synthase I